MRKKIVTCLLLLALAATAAQARSYIAQICSNCAFGDRRKYCIKCGAYTFDKGVPARLCDNCGFGDRWQYCVKCGAYTFGRGAAAVLCQNCAFGDRKKHCLKCGRYLFD